MNDAARRKPGQQVLGCPAISGLTGRQQEGERSALTVGNGVDFGVAAAPADTDRLEVRSPFPPAAERCAFTRVLSINTSAGGHPQPTASPG